MLRIQCKKAKARVPISCIEEIKESGIPVLISQVDRKPAYATLPLEDFIKILADNMEAYK